MLTKRGFLNSIIGAGVGVGGSAVMSESANSSNVAVAIWAVHPEGKHPVRWVSVGSSVVERDGIVSATMDMLVSCELRGVNVRYVELSESAYRMLRKQDAVERVRDSIGNVLWYQFLGHYIYVPNTAVCPPSFVKLYS